MASVYGVNDGLQEIKSASVVARILDGKMRPILTRDWETVLPAGGMRSEPRDINLPIPADMPPTYLFLDLKLTSAKGERLSSRAYWIRVDNLPKDPAAREKQLSSADIVVKSGPWLKLKSRERRRILRPRFLGATRLGRKRGLG